MTGSWRRPRGYSFKLFQVSIIESEEDLEVTNPCQKLVMVQMLKLDIISQMD
jgi:hypothetical protein